MTDHSRIPEQSQQTNFEAVRVSQGDNNVAVVSFKEVEALFEGIKKYNGQFSARLGQNLFIGSGSENNDKKPPWFVNNKPLIKETGIYDILANDLSCRNEQMLDQLGLTLEPVFGNKGKVSIRDTDVRGGELRINIVNGERFVSFLSVLSSDQVMYTNLKYNLENLSISLTSQILDQYDLSNPSDEALQLFGHMAEIIDQYKRLGLGDSIEKMDIYLTHMRQGNLREYIAIEKEDLFNGPDDGWGPAKWQTELLPYELRKSWDNALEILRTTGLNPKAKELYEKLINNLKNCANVASSNILCDLPHNEENFWLYDILKKAKSELDKIFLNK